MRGMPISAKCPNCGTRYSILIRSAEGYREWHEKHPEPFALCSTCWNKAGCPDDDTKWPDGMPGGAGMIFEQAIRGSKTIDELFTAIENRLSPNEFSCERNETWLGVPFLMLNINGHNFRMIPREASVLKLSHDFTCGVCFDRFAKIRVSKRLDREFDIQEPSVMEHVLAHLALVKANEVWEAEPDSN
jgi:hypothetical protein